MSELQIRLVAVALARLDVAADLIEDKHPEVAHMQLKLAVMSLREILNQPA